MSCANPGDTFELYRCARCGQLSPSLGWLHGHIEKHRPLWRVWNTGDVKFLNDNTERITVTEYEVAEV